MANRTDRRRSGRGVPARAREVERTEPEVRRWPHPIPRAADLTGEDTAAHFILCALRYQNELLGELRSLVQGISDRLDRAEDDSGAGGGPA